MKIALTGTQSVGKSTLVKELKKLPQFKDYDILTERSEYLKNLGVQLNGDSTLKGQLVFAAERASELMSENFISDRSIFDICAYSVSSQSMTKWQIQTFCELVLQLKDEYDAIIYVDPEGVEIEDNGIREIDPDYRIKIDKVIQAFLIEYPPKKLIKVKGSTEDRINTILNELNL